MTNNLAPPSRNPQSAIRNPFIICLMGPTASGKTDLAMQLVKELPCDIISVDSAMVYCGMDIGTAKPTKAEQALAPHRLIDICDPKESYSAGQFRQDALREIADILQQGRIPLLVGGTMLYFHLLQQGLATLPTANAEIREQIAAQAEQQGWQALHERLQQIDPVAAARIHPNDPQRIARALEIYEVTGKTLTALAATEVAEPLPYSVINLIVAPADRVLIHERIQLRFQLMLKNGFIDEVEKLFRRGDLNPDLPAIRAVGYRQVWEYLAGSINFETMQERAIIATRQLAKRQLTWLRSWQQATWFDSLDFALIKRILHHLALK